MVTANTVNAFNFDVNSNGGQFQVVRTPIGARCLSDREVDANVQFLKDNLDAVAVRMKRAIREQAKKPLFPEHSERW